MPNETTLKKLSLEAQLTEQQVYNWIRSARKSKKSSHKGLDIDQKLALFQHFNINQYPNDIECKNLSNSLEVSVILIKNWFKRQRFIKKQQFNNIS